MLIIDENDMFEFLIGDKELDVVDKVYEYIYKESKVISDYLLSDDGDDKVISLLVKEK